VLLDCAVADTILLANLICWLAGCTTLFKSTRHL
jgi:hypothetical protein